MSQSERRFDAIDMCDFREGDVWETAGGKQFTVLDRAFISIGKRWVAILDHDFDDPRLASVEVLEQSRARRFHVV